MNSRRRVIPRHHLMQPHHCPYLPSRVPDGLVRLSSHRSDGRMTALWLPPQTRGAKSKLRSVSSSIREWSITFPFTFDTPEKTHRECRIPFSSRCSTPGKSTVWRCCRRAWGGSTLIADLGRSSVSGRLHDVEARFRLKIVKSAVLSLHNSVFKNLAEGTKLVVSCGSIAGAIEMFRTSSTLIRHSHLNAD